MTKADLTTWLREQGQEFPSRATKAQLLEIAEGVAQ